MHYCQKCHLLCTEQRCPKCGNKFLRQPTESDYVFLVEKEYPWSEMLEQALKDEGIAVVTNDAVVGAWITTRLGPRFERSQLFVPYEKLEQAKELVHGLFDAPEFVDFDTEDPES